MAEHEVDEALVAALVADLKACRWRGLADLDRNTPKYKPVRLHYLDDWARDYCQAKGVPAFGRFAQIDTLLQDGLQAYAATGNEAESQFIYSLFFPRPGGPPQSPGEMQHAAKDASGLDDALFTARRNAAFRHFAVFLVAFVASHPAMAAPSDTDLAEPAGVAEASISAVAPVAAAMEPEEAPSEAPATEAPGVESAAAEAAPETAPVAAVGTQTVAAVPMMAAVESTGVASVATATVAPDGEPETVVPAPAAGQPTASATGETSRPRITPLQSSLLRVLSVGLIMTLVFAGGFGLGNLLARQGPTVTQGFTPPTIATFSVGPAFGHTIPEMVGQGGAPTFTDPHTLSVGGHRIPPYTVVQVSCRVFAPTIPSASPDGWWYRIASQPWSDKDYAVANTFQNGDPIGEDNHHTDFAVPVCPA